jgi:hypothetical protein
MLFLFPTLSYGNKTVIRNQQIAYWRIWSVQKDIEQPYEKIANVGISQQDSTWGIFLRIWNMIANRYTVTFRVTRCVNKWNLREGTRYTITLSRTMCFILSTQIVFLLATVVESDIELELRQVIYVQNPCQRNQVTGCKGCWICEGRTLLGIFDRYNQGTK